MQPAATSSTRRPYASRWQPALRFHRQPQHVPSGTRRRQRVSHQHGAISCRWCRRRRLSHSVATPLPLRCHGGRADHFKHRPDSTPVDITLQARAELVLANSTDERRRACRHHHPPRITAASDSAHDQLQSGGKAARPPLPLLLHMQLLRCGGRQRPVRWREVAAAARPHRRGPASPARRARR